MTVLVPDVVVLGQTITVTATFRRGVELVDPIAVVFTVTDPNEVEVIHVPDNPSRGVYSVPIVGDVLGIWKGSWTSTGVDLTGGEDVVWTVEPSP